MVEQLKAKKNTVKRLMVLYTASGQPRIGLSATVRILRESDQQFLQSDGSWQAAPSADPAAVEWSSANFPGIYYYDFQLPDSLDSYLVMFDGSSAMAINRYQHLWVGAISGDEEDIHLARAALVNNQQQSIATGVVTVMDDDGVTPLLSMTPSVDDPDNPATNILTISGAS